MKLIDRHVLRCHLEPFLIGLSLSTGVLFVNVFKEYLDEFLAKGVSPFAILEVLFLSLGHTLALSVPMAVLFATLMAFGQMATDNELTAFKAAGVHLVRVMLPAFIAAALVCIAMLLYNNLVLPESNHRLASLTSDIGRKRPTVSLDAGRFITDFKGYQLLFGSKDEKTSEVGDVQVYIQRPGRLPDLLVAPRGRLRFENAGNTLFIDLFDGEMHAVPDTKQPGQEDLYRHTFFDEHTVVIDDIGTALERTDRSYRGDREMNVGMLQAAIREQERQVQQVRERLGEACQRNMDNKLALLDPGRRAEIFAAHRPSPTRRLVRDEERLRDTVRMEASAVDASLRQIRSYQVEIQKKFAIPVASLIFVLLGAPLAVRSGRAGGSMAIALSMVCFTVYYLFLIGGEKLADRRILSPYVAMWAANVVFAALGIFLTWRVSIESTPFQWRALDLRRWWRARRRPAALPPPAAAA